jgi:hypothetical protein
LYDAHVSDSTEKVVGDQTLMTTARELVKTVRCGMATIHRAIEK